MTKRPSIDVSTLDSGLHRANPDTSPSIYRTADGNFEISQGAVGGGAWTIWPRTEWAVKMVACAELDGLWGRKKDLVCALRSRVYDAPDGLAWKSGPEIEALYLESSSG